MRLSLAARQREFAAGIAALTDLRTRVAFYAIQIDEAERIGRSGFDPDRFMVTSKRKTANGPQEDSGTRGQDLR
jgi:hypothetical protein